MAQESPTREAIPPIEYLNTAEHVRRCKEMFTGDTTFAKDAVFYVFSTPRLLGDLPAFPSADAARRATGGRRKRPRRDASADGVECTLKTLSLSPSTAAERDTPLLAWTRGPRVPGLDHVVLELLCNARDHMVRTEACTRVDVRVDPGQGFVEVSNDGPGLPVEKVSVDHRRPDGKMTSLSLFAPEVAFAVLNTGSNFRADPEKVTGGCNGVGATIAAVMARRAEVYTVDARRAFRQVYLDNLVRREPAEVRPRRPDEPQGTRVRLWPDWQALGVPAADVANAEPLAWPAVVASLRSLVWEVAAATRAVSSSPCHFRFNAVEAPFRSLADLLVAAHGRHAVPSRAVVPWFPLEEEDRASAPPPRISHLALAVMPARRKDLPTFGYVNSIPCPSGVHTRTLQAFFRRALEAQLTEADRKTLRSGRSEPLTATLTRLVGKHWAVAVAVVARNPVFETQTKRALVRSGDMHRWPAVWAESPQLHAAVADNRLLRKCVLEAALRRLRLRTAAAEDLRPLPAAPDHRHDGGRGIRGRRTVAVKGLVDAELAGVAGQPTVLYLCEGLSSEGLVAQCLEDRRYAGTFCVTGVVSSGRKYCPGLKRLFQALGLHPARDYRTASGAQLPRYRHLCRATDQDADGHHIWFLVVKAIYTYVPSLLDRYPDFFRTWFTPLVSVHQRRRPPRYFYSLEEARAAAPTFGAGAVVKYFKGLGTHNARDARVWLRENQTAFRPRDQTTGWRRMERLGGRDSKVRKDAITAYVGQTAAEGDQGAAPPPPSYDQVRHAGVEYLEDFLAHRVTPFYYEKFLRETPRVTDGLKPVQGKLLYTLALQGRRRGPVTVAQLVGQMATLTKYRYGDAAAHHALTLMAQTFPTGAAPVSVVAADGNAGTRRDRDNAAQPRYLKVAPGPLLDLLFPPATLAVLPRSVEDNELVEPVQFSPVLSLLLLHGAKSIGAGWSSWIAPVHPWRLLRTTQRVLAAYEADPAAETLPTPLRGSTVLRNLSPATVRTIAEGLTRDLQPWYDGWRGEMVFCDTDRRVWSALGRLHLCDDLPTSGVNPDGTPWRARAADVQATRAWATLGPPHFDAVEPSPPAARGGRSVVRFQVREFPPYVYAKPFGDLLFQLPWVVDFVIKRDTDDVCVEIHADADAVAALWFQEVDTAGRPVALLRKLKLAFTFSQTNMHAVAPDGTKQHYSVYGMLFLEHMAFHLSTCQRVIRYQAEAATARRRRAANQRRFVEELRQGLLNLDDLDDDDAIDGLLAQRGYAPNESVVDPPEPAREVADLVAPPREGGSGQDGRFGYLTSLAVRRRTRAGLQALQNQEARLTREENDWRAMTPTVLWRVHLDRLEPELYAHLQRKRENEHGLCPSATYIDEPPPPTYAPAFRRLFGGN